MRPRSRGAIPCGVGTSGNDDRFGSGRCGRSATGGPPRLSPLSRFRESPRVRRSRSSRPLCGSSSRLRSTPSERGGLCSTRCVVRGGVNFGAWRVVRHRDSSVHDFAEVEAVGPGPSVVLAAGPSRRYGLRLPPRPSGGGRFRTGRRCSESSGRRTGCLTSISIGPSLPRGVLGSLQVLAVRFRGDARMVRSIVARVSLR